MRKTPEELLALRAANYIRENYPNVPYRFDLVDKVSRLQGKKASSLHGVWSKGYPDMQIMGRGGRALYLELKATLSVPRTAHTDRQRAYHAVMKNLGYKVRFSCGYGDTIRKIDKYMLRCGHEKAN